MSLNRISRSRSRSHCVFLVLMNSVAVGAIQPPPLLDRTYTAAVHASVRLTGALSASIGTSLGPLLLDEAKDAANESSAASTAGDANVELRRCLVAILCAHAAVEAQMNEVGEAVDSP